MLSNYAFLSDHSYSLRPDADDKHALSLNQHEGKSKKRRRSSNRTNETTSTTNRTVSIDRTSSDKENSSLILSNSDRATKTSGNTKKSSTKKKPMESRRSRLSVRTATNTSRTQAGKKQDQKTSAKIGVKSTQGSIVKKKLVNNRDTTKSSNISPKTLTDLSLSIEERVKLRRTKPLPPTVVDRKTHTIRPSKTGNSSKVEKQSQRTKTSPVASSMKTTKLFLGSGLDLDNIVLGNRQRRCVQT